MLGEINKRLNIERINFHNMFDPIWKSGKISRSDLYKELAAFMGLPEEDAHGVKFNLEQCHRAQVFAMTWEKKK